MATCLILIWFLRSHLSPCTLFWLLPMCSLRTKYGITLMVYPLLPYRSLALFCILQIRVLCLRVGVLRLLRYRRFRPSTSFLSQIRVSFGVTQRTPSSTAQRPKRIPPQVSDPATLNVSLRSSFVFAIAGGASMTLFWSESEEGKGDPAHD